MALLELEKNDIRGIIFDCDGTLVDTLSVHLDAWAVVFKKYGITTPISYLDKFNSCPSWFIAEDLLKLEGLDFDPNALADEKEALYFDNLKSAKVLENIVEYVKFYFKKMPMIVLSGGVSRGVKKSLEINNLSSYFDRIIGADEEFPPKTEPASFVEVAKHFEIEPNNWVVFEDGDVGLENALLAGMKVVDVRKSPLIIEG